jgi:hypothetical protein
MGCLGFSQEHRFKDGDSIAAILGSLVKLLEVVLILDVDEEEARQCFGSRVHLVHKLGDNSKTSAGSSHGVFEVILVPVLYHLRAIPIAENFWEIITLMFYNSTVVGSLPL